MKPIFAATAILASITLIGCATDDDYYGGSEPAFSTPSWGTSSGTNVTTDMPQRTAPETPQPPPTETY